MINHFVKLLVLLCVTFECNGHYPAEADTIVVVVEDDGNNRYPVQNTFGNRYPSNINYNNYNNVARPGYNYNQGSWNVNYRPNYQNYRPQRPQQPPKEDGVIVVVVEEDPGKYGPKTSQNVYGNLYNNPQRPYSQGNGNYNYGNPQNNYQTPSQGPNQYRPEKTTEMDHHVNNGDNGNIGSTTIRAEETKPTFGSVHNEPTEDPAKYKTTKGAPSLVPLNPNEYIYGGDKITVNAPKRETDKKEHENVDNEKDEDLDIDIRTLN